MPFSGSASPAKLLVLADDLTGALDVSAEFGRRAIPTLVATRFPDDLELLWAKYDVISVDTQSRHLPADQAFQRLKSFARAGQQTQATHFFKKTDSTLRGNIGQELHAIADACAHPIYYVAAAPLYGRFTRAGYQFVNDVPLHKSDFANDPLNPITTSHVPTLLQAQSPLPVLHLQPSKLPAFAPPLDPAIVLIDANTEADLAFIMQCLSHKSALRVLAGTARFSSYLPQALPFNSATPIIRPPAAPMLVINGSANETALEQVRVALNQSHLRAIHLPPEIVASKNGAFSSAANQLLAQIQSQPPNHLLLHTILRREQLPAYVQFGLQASIPANELHSIVAANTAQFVRRLFEIVSFPFIVIFGGDTLCALAHAFQWPGFCPQGEIVPGVALSSVLDHPSLTLATKPGGFGPPNVIDTIRQFTI